MNLKTALRIFTRNQKFFLVTVILLMFMAAFLQPASAAQITEYPLTTIQNPDPRPRNIAVDDGKLWFTEQYANRIGLKSGSTIYEWKVPTGGSEPWDIVVDQNGDPWFTMYHGNKICKFDKPYFYEFDLPTFGGQTDIRPMGITMDNNYTFRNIWWVEFDGNAIGRLYYNGSGALRYRWVVHRYIIPVSDSGPMDIAVSPYNGYIWFTQYKSKQIGCFNPWTLTFKEYSLFPLLDGSDYHPESIGVDSSGFIWFTLDLADANEYDKIGRLNPWTAEIAVYNIPTQDSGPADLVIDENNEIWVTLYDVGKIARLSPVNRYVTEFELPNPTSYPIGIATSEDGETPIYYTDWLGNSIGRLNPDAGQEYSTVNTITSATTALSTNPTTTTNVAPAEEHVYVFSTSPTTVPATSFVDTSRVTTTDSTNKYAASSLTTFTETVFALPTTTTVTTTHSLISTSTVETTVSPTLTTYVSTTSTTTTTTQSATYSSPVATESTVVTRQEVFTDYISTTTMTEYAATSYRFRTTTVQFYTSYQTSVIWSTITIYTTITETVTEYVTVTAGGGIASLAFISIMLGLLIFRRTRSRSSGG